MLNSRTPGQKTVAFEGKQSFRRPKYRQAAILQVGNWKADFISSQSERTFP